MASPARGRPHVLPTPISIRAASRPRELPCISGTTDERPRRCGDGRMAIASHHQALGRCLCVRAGGAGRGHRCDDRRRLPLGDVAHDVRLGRACRARPARCRSTALRDPHRPQPRLPRRSGLRRRRRARATARAARRARRRPLHPRVAEGALLLVHPELQHRELRARGARRVRSRQPARGRRPAHGRDLPGGRGRLRARQPRPARPDAAARPWPFRPGERAVRGAQPRRRLRPRQPGHRRRAPPRDEPAAPPHPDRAARARAPLALDGLAPPPERGAVPRHVRVVRHGDGDLRPQRSDHRREQRGLGSLRAPARDAAAALAKRPPPPRRGRLGRVRGADARRA